jgi:hypothetical protein
MSHDRAIRAAAEAVQASEPWSQFWSHTDAEAMCRAAIVAFLGAVEVSEGMVDAAAWGYDREDGRAQIVHDVMDTALAQLAREVNVPVDTPATPST